MPGNSIEFFVDWLVANDYTLFTHNTRQGILYEAVNNKNTKKIVIFAKPSEEELILRASRDGGDTHEDFTDVDDCIKYLSLDKIEDKYNIDITQHTITVQAIREDINGEYDAIKEYEEHVILYTDLYNQTRDEIYLDLIKITKDIITEEYTHVGELNELLSKVNPGEIEKFKEGVEEAQEKLSTTTIYDDEKDTRERNEFWVPNNHKDSNTHIPYGLCKKYGIKLPEKATPKQAWEALRKEGITPEETYKSLEETETIEQVKSNEEELVESTTNNQNTHKQSQFKSQEIKIQKQQRQQTHQQEIYSDERKNNALTFTGVDGPKCSYEKYKPSTWKLWQTLTDDEREALYKYTEDSDNINKSLRGQSAPDIESLDYIESIDTAMSESPLSQDIWVNRHLDIEGASKFLNIEALFGKFDIDDLNDLELDALCNTRPVEKAFCSCSAASDSEFEHQYPCHFNIFCPQGTQAIYLEPISYWGGRKGDPDTVWNGEDTVVQGENEMLLQRNLKFKVTQASKKDGQYYFTLEIIKRRV